MIKRALAIPFLLLFATLSPAQDDGGESNHPRISGQVQLWNVYSTNASDPSGQPVEDRWDLYLRRARLGLDGLIGKRIDYKITFAYDNIGKNAYTAATGAAQELDNAEFKLWDAYFTWAAHERWLNVTMGYFRPQIGRESITTAFEVDSLTKALNNVYPRLHLIDSGPGRETGINVGGLYHPGGWGIHYNLGIFDVDHEEVDGQPGGVRWSPMLAGRLSFTLGQPEMEEYGLAYRVNYFGKRDGATLSLNYARQEGTDSFDGNSLMGGDILLNYGPLNVSAEYDRLERDTGVISYADNVYFVRCGFNIPLRNGEVLEPVVMYSKFAGDVNSVDNPSGFHEIKQINLNWYVNGNRFKINASYSWQDDNLASGDFAGLGVQLIY